MPNQTESETSKRMAAYQGLDDYIWMRVARVVSDGRELSVYSHLVADVMELIRERLDEESSKQVAGLVCDIVDPGHILHGGGK